jgi:RNA polymerase sigma-70 factor, ECF subfamily
VGCDRRAPGAVDAATSREPVAASLLRRRRRLTGRRRWVFRTVQGFQAEDRLELAPRVDAIDQPRRRASGSPWAICSTAGGGSPRRGGPPTRGGTPARVIEGRQRPPFGHAPIGKLTTADIDDFYAHLLVAGRLRPLLSTPTPSPPATAAPPRSMARRRVVLLQLSRRISFPGTIDAGRCHPPDEARLRRRACAHVRRSSTRCHTIARCGVYVCVRLASLSSPNRDAGADPDQEAFRAIYGRARRLAAVLAPPDIEPDDLVQEALYRALRRGGPPAPEELLAYLGTTMVNIIRNESRRGRRRTNALNRLRGAAAAQVDSYPSDVGELWLLKPSERGLLVLVDLEGMSFAEAAEIVGCSEGAARKRASRARKRLATQLDQEV